MSKLVARDRLGRFRTRLRTPFDAGWDSVEKGPDTENCHFAWFTTKERTKEWEKGHEEAKKRLTLSTTEQEPDNG